MIRNTTVRLSALVLLLGFVGVSSAQDPVKPIKVPFDLLKSQHMVINVKINGKGPYRLIFDTGSPVNLINTKVAAATGLGGEDGGKNPLGGLMGGGQQIKMKTLQLGDIKAENLPAVVMNHPTVETISKVLGPVEGIIGYPFFARYRMTIDYQAKEMTFVPSGFEPKDSLNSLQMTLFGGGKKKAMAPIVPAAQWGVRVAKEAKDEDAGVNIVEVFAGSPADVAGLKAGDRLLTIDDRWTDSVADCYSAAAAIRPGDTVRVVIRRGNEAQTLKLTVRAGV